MMHCLLCKLYLIVGAQLVLLCYLNYNNLLVDGAAGVEQHSNRAVIPGAAAEPNDLNSSAYDDDDNLVNEPEPEHEQMEQSYNIPALLSHWEELKSFVLNSDQKMEKLAYDLNATLQEIKTKQDAIEGSLLVIQQRDVVLEERINHLEDSKTAEITQNLQQIRNELTQEVEVKMEEALGKEASKFTEEKALLESKLNVVQDAVEGLARVSGLYTWKVNNVSALLGQDSTEVFSDFFYTKCCYKARVRLEINKQNVGVYIQFTAGNYDEFLEWPFTNQINWIIFDQTIEQAENLDAISKSECQNFQKQDGSDISTTPGPPQSQPNWCGVESFTTPDVLTTRNYIVNDSLLLGVMFDCWEESSLLCANRIESYEIVWRDFLDKLFIELSSEEVQVDQIWGLKQWWENHKNITNEISFDTFWDVFKELSCVQNLNMDEMGEVLLENTESKLEDLSFLLETTLSKPLCTMNGTTTILEGNYVSNGDVQQGTCTQKQTTTTIIIYAYHTFFLHDTLKTTLINNSTNVNMLIISPTWITKAGSILDLNGATPEPHSPITGKGSMHGKHGKPGGHSGNLLVISGKFVNGLPQVEVNGGTGTNGQPGQNGSDGSKGQQIYLDRYNCDAYYGGKLSFSVPYGYTCASWSGGYCYAGNWGVEVRAHGGSGTPGQAGGHGGKGGRGGTPGTYIIAQVDCNNSTVYVNRIIGTPGPDGVDGSGGQGGLGGSTGDTAVATIDDKWDFGKYCAVWNRWWSPVNSRAEAGKNGVTGGSPGPTITPTSATFNFSDFTPYLLDYKNKLRERLGNKFLGPEIYSFYAQLGNDNNELHKEIFDMSSSLDSD